MHIGIISPCSSGPLADLLPESGGVDLGCGVHFMATLVRALIERGHRLSVVTLSEEISEKRIFEGPKLAFYVYPMRSRRRMRDLFKLEREGLREGILRAKPEILHAHWTYEFAMASLDSDLPTLVTSHDNAFQQLRFSKDLYRLGRLYMQIKVVRRAQHLSVVSPYLARTLSWLAIKPVEVIPNPIFIPRQPVEVRWQSTEMVKIATVLNGWGNRKNPKKAIEAFSRLRRKLPAAQLFMYGQDFEVGGPAAMWASNAGLSENIRFRGFLTPRDLQNELRQMSVLLHPALEEACPLVLLEAMALGIPIVAGRNAGGVPWVLDDGRAGFLTDVSDPDSIFQALIDCIEREDIREEKQKAARERVEKVFSPSSIAGQYEQIYERILSLH
jgi:L-malate glycosyltransferase